MYFQERNKRGGSPQRRQDDPKNCQRIESNTAARTKRSPLPRKIREIAWEIKQGMARTKKQKVDARDRQGIEILNEAESQQHARGRTKAPAHNTSANGKCRPTKDGAKALESGGPGGHRDQDNAGRLSAVSA